VGLADSLKQIMPLFTERVQLLGFLKNFFWNIRINSEQGRKALEGPAAELKLKFPVELELKPNEPWRAYYPMLMRYKKDDRGFVLSLKHRANYYEEDTLVRAVHFLNGAKMVETGFPGMMTGMDRNARDIFAEIAWQIREPYFPGGDTPYYGRVYPYPVFRGSQDENAGEYAVYRAIITFYQQELLAGMYPKPVSEHGEGGQLYEFNLLMTLLPDKSKSTSTMVDEIARVTAESKLNYARKWAWVSAFISDELVPLVEAHGSDLFLEALKERWGSSKVQTVYDIISQLPLEQGKGFAPPVLHDIYRVLNELHVFLRH